MRERPILLNAEMVRAVLDGRKTQTRRIMKNQPVPSKTREGDFWFSCNKMCSMVHVSDFIPGNCANLPDAHEFFSMCSPFGAVGDRLWVRETCWIYGYWQPESDFECAGFHRLGKRVAYRASDTKPTDGLTINREWRVYPSIHMPRWASRITLEITGVRVERLNFIDEIGAMREGIQNLTTYSHVDFGIPGVVNAQNPVRAFQLLWQGICGEESWQANPWVWVIEFKRVDNTTDKAG